MKPFRFPLQPLRAVRQHKEQLARERYVRAVRVCEEAAARAESAREELTVCWQMRSDKLEAGATGGDLVRARAWCQALEVRVKERTAALQTARQAAEAVWQELTLATREREA